MNKHKSWTIWPSDDFVIGKLVLGINEHAPVVSTVPPRATFTENNLGINLFRFNAFVNGRFELRSSLVPWLIKGRGDGGEDQRVSVNGNFLFKALDDTTNVFYCVSVAEGNNKIYWSSNHPLEPGQSCTFVDRELDRHVFILEGAVSCNGSEHSEFKKLTLSQSVDYTFTNETDSPAYVLFVYEISVTEARSLLSYIPSEDLDTVPCLKVE